MAGESANGDVKPPRFAEGSLVEDAPCAGTLFFHFDVMNPSASTSSAAFLANSSEQRPHWQEIYQTKWRCFGRMLYPSMEIVFLSKKNTQKMHLEWW